MRGKRVYGRVVVGLAPLRAVGDALHVADPDGQPAFTPLAQLRASARGWHGVQLATIGVSVNGSPVVVSLADVAAVSPVDHC
jgi:hypothetical protein